MPLHLGHSPLLLALALLGVAALAAWAYGRLVPDARRRGVLVALRGAALGLVVLLLFEPVWNGVDEEERPATLAVVVDDSRSIVLADSALGDRLRAATRLDGLGADVRFFAFADEARAAEPDSLAFAGERTDIAGALEGARRATEDGTLRGVVLVSDGRYNVGRNPLYVAEAYPAPLYSVTVGDTTARRDVRLADLVTNDLAYAGTALPFRLAVQAEGFEGQTARVALYEGRARLADGAVTLPASGAEATVELVTTPTRPGLHRYTAVVGPLDGEATDENNRATVTVRVLESRRRVLFLAAAPGPDVAALRQTMDRDPNARITPRTHRAPGAYYEGPLPARLDTFDVAVLAGWPGTATPPAEVRRVRDAALAGLPVVFWLTPQTNLPALQHLADVLPASPEVPRPGAFEAALAPTAAGAAHPVLAGTVGAALPVDRLPPAVVSESRWRVAPDAEVLATARVRGVDLGQPTLAVRRRPDGRSAAVLAAGTWRWATLPDALDALDAFYPSLSEALVGWTATREDRRLVRVRPTRDLFGPGERVTLAGQVYDERLQPLADATVRVEIADSTGARRTLGMTAIGNGRYTLDAGPMPEGAYAFAAQAEWRGGPVGEDAGQFAVGALGLEARTPGADAELMRALAARSGGAVVPLEGLEAFLRGLERDGHLAPEVVRRETTWPLWHWPLLLGLIVALLVAEWVLRKRWGLA